MKFENKLHPFQCSQMVVKQETKSILNQFLLLESNSQTNIHNGNVLMGVEN